MRKRTLAIITGFSMIVGAGTGVLAKTEPVIKYCSNTWCAPTDPVCYELTGWNCELSGGCSGTSRCT